MISEYKHRSNVIGAISLWLFVIFLIFVTKRLPPSAIQWIGGLAGTFFMVGAGYYAKAKGYTFWLVFLGLLGPVGWIILLCLPDKSLQQESHLEPLKQASKPSTPQSRITSPVTNPPLIGRGSHKEDYEVEVESNLEDERIKPNKKFDERTLEILAEMKKNPSRKSTDEETSPPKDPYRIIEQGRVKHMWRIGKLREMACRQCGISHLVSYYVRDYVCPVCAKTEPTYEVYHLLSLEKIAPEPMTDGEVCDEELEKLRKETEELQKLKTELEAEAVAQKMMEEKQSKRREEKARLQEQIKQLKEDIKQMQLCLSGIPTEKKRHTDYIRESEERVERYEKSLEETERRLEKRKKGTKPAKVRPKGLHEAFEMLQKQERQGNK